MANVTESPTVVNLSRRRERPAARRHRTAPWRARMDGEVAAAQAKQQALFDLLDCNRGVQCPMCHTRWSLWLRRPGQRCGDLILTDWYGERGCPGRVQHNLKD